MRKISVLFMVAVALVMSACFKNDDNYQPDPMMPAYSYYGYTSIQNEIALLPASIAKRLDLYVANGKSATAKNKLFPETTIEESSTTSGMWTLTFNQFEINGYKISGTLLVDKTDVDHTAISTLPDKTIDIPGLGVGLSLRDKYLVTPISAKEFEVDMTIETLTSNTNKSYAWSGTYRVVEHNDNSTDLTTINLWKYQFTTATAQGAVAFGDSYFVAPGMKFSYAVKSALHYAYVNNKLTLCSGKEEVVPYAAGSAEPTYKVEVLTKSINKENPYAVRDSISYTYMGQTVSFKR